MLSELETVEEKGAVFCECGLNPRCDGGVESCGSSLIFGSAVTVDADLEFIDMVCS